ncbi:hypothetical protein CY35_13G104500 [Sphagnum magellanicum]|nr:hypothetical protein CY35_13G104500 [Sphagnum magellanicum]
MIFEVFFFFFFGMCYYSFSCFYSYFCLILILFLVLVVYASLNLHLALWVLYSPTAKWNIRMWQLCVLRFLVLIFPSNQTKHNGKQQNSGDWSNWSIWTIHRQGS